MPPHRLRRDGELGRVILAGDLEARPLAPQVDAGRRFDDVDYVGASDTRRGLEKMPGAVVGADELRVRHTANQSERLEDARVEVFERGGVRIARRERARHEDAGIVRHDERRRFVAAHTREAHVEVEHDRIDVKDITRDELLEQIVGAAVAKRLECAPEITGRVEASNAERRRLRPWLEDPRRCYLGRPSS